MEIYLSWILDLLKRSKTGSATLTATIPTRPYKEKTEIPKEHLEPGVLVATWSPSEWGVLKEEHWGLSPILSVEDRLGSTPHFLQVKWGGLPGTSGAPASHFLLNVCWTTAASRATTAWPPEKRIVGETLGKTGLCPCSVGTCVNIQTCVCSSPENSEAGVWLEHPRMLGKETWQPSPGKVRQEKVTVGHGSLRDTFSIPGARGLSARWEKAMRRLWAWSKGRGVTGDGWKSSSLSQQAEQSRSPTRRSREEPLALPPASLTPAEMAAIGQQSTTAALAKQAQLLTFLLSDPPSPRIGMKEGGSMQGFQITEQPGRRGNWDWDVRLKFLFRLDGF